MNKKFIILLISFFISSIVFAQSNCKQIKNGSFYFYPIPEKKYAILRKDTIQREIDLNTNDTSYWKIKWTDECIFSLNFLNTTKKMSEEKKAAYNAHTILIKVNSVTNKYYTFSGSFDSLNNIISASDTLWLNAKN